MTASLEDRTDPATAEVFHDGGDSVPEESARAFLRRTTDLHHQAVEKAFAVYDLTTRAGLIRFLTAQHVAVFAIETELERQGIGRLVQDWPERRRTEALAADLARLGAQPQTRDSVPAPIFENVGRQFGALYVLEGSRLGGRVLARRVASSKDPEVQAATGFLLHRVHSPEPWATFVTALDHLPAPREDLLDGTRAAFDLFRQAAIRFADGLKTL